MGCQEKRNRSVNQFQGIVRDLAEAAANKIEIITLFEDPLPDPKRSEEIIDHAWRETESELRLGHTRDHKIDSYVGIAVAQRSYIPLTTPPQLRSIQSRTRSHIVFETKKMITNLYEINVDEPATSIKNHTKRLLFEDRFTCARREREVLTAVITLGTVRS